MAAKIMLATGMPGVDEFIAQNYDEVYAAEDGVTLLDYTGEGDIAVIAITFLDERDLVETIYRLQMKGVRVVIIVDNQVQGGALLQSLLTMGVFDFVLKPSDGDELVSVIETPGNVASARRKLGAVIDLMQTVVPENQNGRVGAVQPADRLDCAFTPAGGAGKTTTTVYVAAALQRFNIPVGILELDEDKPGIASIFLGNEKARRDIGLDKIDLKTYRSETSLEKELNNIRMSLTKGIMLYPNSGTGDGMPFEETDDVYRLFEVAQRQHPFVMVDLPVRLKDMVVLSTLRRANRVFFICEQYQPTIDACARHLEDVLKLGINPDKYILLINKYTEDSRIRVARIESALGMKAKALIPLDAERYRVAADSHKITIQDDDPWVNLAAMVAGVDIPVTPQKVKNKAKGKYGGILNLFGLINYLKKRKSEASA